MNTPSKKDWPSWLARDDVSDDAKVGALRKYVIAVGALPEGCDSLWSEAANLADRSGDRGLLLGKLLPQLDLRTTARLVRSAPPSEANQFAVGLIAVCAADASLKPILSKVVRSLDEQGVCTLARSLAGHADRYPPDEPLLGQRLRKLLQSLPDQPARFHARLDALRSGGPLLPEGGDRIRAWRKFQVSLREFEELANQKSGLFASGRARCEDAARELVACLCNVMFDGAYLDDEQGSKKLRLLRELLAQASIPPKALPDQFEGKAANYFRTGAWRVAPKKAPASKKAAAATSGQAATAKARAAGGKSSPRRQAAQRAPVAPTGQPVGSSHPSASPSAPRLLSRLGAFWGVFVALGVLAVGALVTVVVVDVLSDDDQGHDQVAESTTPDLPDQVQEDIETDPEMDPPVLPPEEKPPAKPTPKTPPPAKPTPKTPDKPPVEKPTRDKPPPDKRPRVERPAEKPTLDKPIPKKDPFEPVVPEKPLDEPDVLDDTPEEPVVPEKLAKIFDVPEKPAEPEVPLPKSDDPSSTGPALLQIREADYLIDQAQGLISRGDAKEASKVLLKADRTYSADLRPDFYLGLLEAFMNHSPVDARKHFRACTRRAPKCVACFNNLAIAEVRLNKVSEATRNWRTALELQPATAEVIHNVGVVLELADQKRIQLSSSIRRALAASCPEAVTNSYGSVAFHYMDYPAQAGQASTWRWPELVDRACLKCNGRRTMACPNRDCKRGMIISRVVVAAGRTPAGVVYQEKKVSSPCGVCRGRALVPCQTCGGSGSER